MTRLAKLLSMNWQSYWIKYFFSLVPFKHWLKKMRNEFQRCSKMLIQDVSFIGFKIRKLLKTFLLLIQLIDCCTVRWHTYMRDCHRVEWTWSATFTELWSYKGVFGMWLRVFNSVDLASVQLCLLRSVHNVYMVSLKLNKYVF